MVQSVPMELSPDLLMTLSAAQTAGFITARALVATTGWTEQRAELALVRRRDGRAPVPLPSLRSDRARACTSVGGHARFRSRWR